MKNIDELMDMEKEKWPMGTFVRVRSDHHWGIRAGADAMVVQDLGGGVAAVFGFDRNNEPQNVQCVGREVWLKSELDESTLCFPPPRNHCTCIAPNSK